MLITLFAYSGSLIAASLVGAEIKAARLRPIIDKLHLEVKIKSGDVRFIDSMLRREINRQLREIEKLRHEAAANAGLDRDPKTGRYLSRRKG